MPTINNIEALLRRTLDRMKNTFKQPSIILYEFIPKTDITAYEVAVILKLTIEKSPNEVVEKLPENVKRHLQKVMLDMNTGNKTPVTF